MKITKCNPDLGSLSTQMLGRLDETLRFCLDNNCFKLCFMNPLVLIESDELTSQFLEAIQIWRNRWCPQFKRCRKV